MSDLAAPTPMGEDTAALTEDRFMSLRWFDDRERWSKERMIDLGQTGDMFPTIRFHRLGTYRTRQWEVVLPANVAQCVVMMDGNNDSDSDCGGRIYETRWL